MTDYHRASRTNLVVGIALILLGVSGILSLGSSLSGGNFFWAMIFLLVFVLVGGYETGKYAEMRHEQRKSDG